MNIDELLALTPEQQKAWNRLIKAHKDFLKLGGKVHMVLNSMSPYNCKYVDKITNPEHEYIIPDDEMYVIDFDCNLPSDYDFKTSSFADDTHVVILNEKGKKKLITQSNCKL